MSKKENDRRRRTFDERNKMVMNQMFGGELESIPRWNRKDFDGFCTLPRWLPLINRMIDRKSPGKPLSSTYLSLWFRVNDDSFLNIKDEKALANESGFESERAVSTWKQRMKSLKELGFIKVKPGEKSEYQYVILVNPYLVIKDMQEQDESMMKYFASLIERMDEVGGLPSG